MVKSKSILYQISVNTRQIEVSPEPSCLTPLLYLCWTLTGKLVSTEVYKRYKSVRAEMVGDISGVAKLGNSIYGV